MIAKPLLLKFLRFNAFVFGYVSQIPYIIQNSSLARIHLLREKASCNLKILDGKLIREPSSLENKKIKLKLN